MADHQLRISEIFYSLQGETTFVGLPTVFVRLTGCPLRCLYCDTAYAFQGGEKYDIDTILQSVKSYHTRYVTVTGGEPLAQVHCKDLLVRLCDEGFVVSLETSGAMDIAAIDERIYRIVDLKTPSSAELEKNLYTNIDHLTQRDQVKFVIATRADFTWACEIVKQYQLTDRCEILFAPVSWMGLDLPNAIKADQLTETALAELILENRLAVRFQLQMHKKLWGNCEGK
ncbi:MAG: 7-carboxy-7-deazaguanine synthase QueE [Thiohalomonadales bacterium]